MSTKPAVTHQAASTATMGTRPAASVHQDAIAQTFPAMPTVYIAPVVANDDAKGDCHTANEKAAAFTQTASPAPMPATVSSDPGTIRQVVAAAPGLIRQTVSIVSPWCKAAASTHTDDHTPAHPNPYVNPNAHSDSHPNAQSDAAAKANPEAYTEATSEAGLSATAANAPSDASPHAIPGADEAANPETDPAAAPKTDLKPNVQPDAYPGLAPEPLLHPSRLQRLTWAHYCQHSYRGQYDEASQASRKQATGKLASAANAYAVLTRIKRRIVAHSRICLSAFVGVHHIVRIFSKQCLAIDTVVTS